MQNNSTMEKRSIRAVPTLFRGIEFKSKLEARFARVLTNAEIGFIYEPSRWRYGYLPDFLIPELRLYVEVKPRHFTDEIAYFQAEIESSAHAWIWVDSEESDGWTLVNYNPAFHRLCPRNVIIVPRCGTVQFLRNKKGQQKLFFEAQVSYPGLQ